MSLSRCATVLIVTVTAAIFMICNATKLWCDVQEVSTSAVVSKKWTGSPGTKQSLERSEPSLKRSTSPSPCAYFTICDTVNSQDVQIPQFVETYVVGDASGVSDYLIQVT